MSDTRDNDDRAFAQVDFTAVDAAATAGGPRVTREARPVPVVLSTALIVLAMTAGSVALFGFISIPTVPSVGARLFFLAHAIGGTAVLGAVIAFFVRWSRRYGRRLPLVNSRLGDFAQANGFEFRAVSELDTTLPPAAGQQFNNPRVGPVLRSTVGPGGPRFEIGYRFFHAPVDPGFVPSTKRPYPITLDYGWYAAIQLPRRLPHIALLRRAELSDSNLDQRAAYSMGIEFDATFTLLVPPGYERDALYLFTPDVMAEMLDDAGASAWGAEVLDDWLFFRFPLGTLPSAIVAEDLRHAFVLLDGTAAELAKQAARYRDERVGDRTLDRIADHGRRVGTRIRPTAIVAGFGLPLMILAPSAMITIGALAFA